MRYQLLGRSGLRVSELCLGTMTFGEEWGWGASRQESRRVYDAFREAGGNFIDTANKYTEGTSERYLGEFMAAEREAVVLATKYTLTMNPGDPNASGNHRKNLVQSVEASLKRLKTDYIDLLWVHAWDFLTPTEEIMRALDDLVRRGKILYVGVSDAPAWEVSRANTLAELRGWTPFVGLQIQYSLVERTAERELLPMARAMDIGVTAWSPLGGGVLTGKYKTGQNDAKRYDGSSPFSDYFLSRRNLAVAQSVETVARSLGKSPSQVALNWLIGRRDGGVLIPIVGARTQEHLQDNLGCLDFSLPPEQRDELDRVSAIEPGFPHDFLELEPVKALVYGDRLPEIEDHRK